MWIIFGISTIFIVFIFNIYKRIYFVWHGNKKFFQNIEYEYKFETNKEKILTVLIATKSTNLNNFTLKFENSFDRFFKKIGLSKEYQINNSEFNDKLYLICDNEAFNNFIYNNEIIQKKFLEIFDNYSSFGCEILELQNQNEKMWIKLKNISFKEEEHFQKILEKIIPLFEEIKAQFENEEITKSFKSYKDTFLLKSIIILSISSSLFITGLVYVYRQSFISSLPSNIDNLSDISFYFALIIIFFLIFITIYFLRNSSRFHIVLFEILIFGFIGSFLTSYMFLSDINRYFDTSFPKVFKVTLLKKERVSHRKGPDSYYLYFNNWVTNRNEYKLNVNSALYYKFNERDKVEIYQKDGFLNYQWIEYIKKAKE